MLETVWRKGNPPALLVGMEAGNNHWKTVFLRKLNIELPYDPEIPFLGKYPDKTVIQKETCTHMFTAALFITARHGNNLNVHQ